MVFLVTEGQIQTEGNIGTVKSTALETQQELNFSKWQRGKRTALAWGRMRGVEDKSQDEEGCRCYQQPWKSKDEKGIDRKNSDLWVTILCWLHPVFLSPASCNERIKLDLWHIFAGEWILQPQNHDFTGEWTQKEICYSRSNIYLNHKSDRTIWSNPSSQAGTPRSGCPWPYSGSFWSSPSRFHNFSGQPVPELPYSHTEEMLPDVRMKPPLFQFVHFTSCPGTGYYRKEAGCLGNFPSGIYRHWKDPLWDSISPDCQRQVVVSGFQAKHASAARAGTCMTQCMAWHTGSTASGTPMAAIVAWVLLFALEDWTEGWFPEVPGHWGNSSKHAA